MPLSPGHRNEFHAGLSQAFGKYLVVDGEYIWKYTHKAYDFSVLGNTPITYPIEWASSKIPGYAIRATMPNFHGLTAFVVMSSVAARFFGPQVSGIGATPGAISVFRIDHDEALQSTTHLQYQPSKKLPWISFNWRTTAAWWPVRCRAREAIAPTGRMAPTRIVDVSGLTPDQQFEGGLYLRQRPCDADHSDQSDGSLPGEPVRFQPGIYPRAGHRERRPQPAPHRVAQSVRHWRGPRQHLPRRQVQV